MIACGKVLAIVKICTEGYCVVEVIGFCHHYFCHIVTKLDSLCCQMLSLNQLTDHRPYHIHF